ncbi:MAG: hypothetical protein KGL39_10260 [Patescibacteria group bacterium]|nr:hypothetical protein [Patescibacteria group bacterium]
MNPTKQEFEMMQERVNKAKNASKTLYDGRGEAFEPKTNPETPKCATADFNVPEKELQRKLADLLRLKGITFISPAFGRKTRIKSGWPDMSFAINGQACAFEVKVGYNQPSEAQTLTMMAMTSNGWHVAVIRNLEQAFEFLKQHGVN